MLSDLRQKSMVSASLGLLAVSASVAAAVYENDDRRPLNSAQSARFGEGAGVIYCKDWERNGLWHFTSATVSGSRRQLIGSGHWRRRNESGWDFEPKHCVFRIYGPDKKKRFESDIESFENFGQTATFVLERAVPRSVMSHEPVPAVAMSLEKIYDLPEVDLLAHHEDLDKKTTYLSGGCKAKKSVRGYPYFIHRCDETGGSSGGAIFAYISGEAKIVGVNVGEFPNGSIAYAIEERVIESLRRNKP